MSIRRVTIHDVAKVAGVSHTTVSFVLHNDPRISQATREKVLAAVKELNYHPNELARSLVQGRSNTIAIIAPIASSSFEIEVMKGIENGFNESHTQYALMQFSTRNDPSMFEHLLSQIVFCRKADAVIALNLPVDDSLVASFQKNQVPLVLIENHTTQASSVCTNSRAGGALAAKHLLELGRKRIGIVSGSIEGAFGSALARYEGFVSALQSQNQTLPDPCFIKINDYSFESGQASLASILSNNLDGVFCAAGDWVAMGIIDAAKKQGIKIPESFSLIGYDNIFASGLISPSLTTIEQPLQAMGRHALNLCLEALASDSFEVVHTIYQPDLLVRETS